MNMHTFGNGRFLKCRKLAAMAASFLFSVSLPLRGMAATDPEFRITGILPTKSEGVYWQEIITGMEQAAHDLDVDLSIIYTESYDNYPAIDLNSALETATLYQAGAIILSYSKNADEETDRLLLQAKEAGIRIIMIDNDTDSSLRDAYVGIDNEEAGRRLAQMALDELEEDRSAVLLYSLQNSDMENISRRIQGISSAFESSSAASRLLTLPVDAGTDLQRMEYLEEILEKYPQIGAIFTLSERTTITAAQYLAQNNLTDTIRIYGFDYTDEAADLLESGELSVVVGQQQNQMGYESVHTAARLLEGDVLDTDKVFIDYQIYTEENIAQNQSERKQ